MKPALLAVLAATQLACAVSNHATTRSDLGVARSTTDMIAVLAQPGPVTVDTIVSTDWTVDRKGLINLKHPTARAAGIKKGPEPIQIYFHVLRHPTHGTFLVDTGVETALRDAPKQAAVRGVLAKFLKTRDMSFTQPLGVWLSKNPQPIAGVFLTHLHIDHVTGLPDVPAGTPVYTGPGETRERSFLNMFTRRSVQRTLAGKPALREWQYLPDAAGRFDGVLDIFGDGSVWALWIPGHTPGSTAFLVRTPQGPVLLVGDASHTRWGWDHGVEPGKFSADIPRSAVSLDRLQSLTKENPQIDVRLGHQR